LPRALLFWGLHLPTAAFAVNVAVRVAGAAWLVYTAWRASSDGRVLRWAAVFIFIYYLYLHAFLQSWYLLSLLPLLAFLPSALVRPAQLFVFSLLVYYVVDIPCSCADSARIGRWALVHVSEGVIVLVPATLCLLRERRRAIASERQIHDLG
jgi:hypothetical protein